MPKMRGSRPIDDAREAQENGRSAEALDMAHGVLATEPNDPDSLHLAGMALVQLGRRDAALAVYTKAHALYPTAEGLACNLAGLLRQMDRSGEAAGVYRTLLAGKPGSAEALLGLSLSAAPAEEDVTDTALHGLLASDSLSAEGRIALLFAWANRHHWTGNIDAAFLAYREANEALRAAQPGYDLDAFAATVDTLMHDFTGEIFAAAGHWGVDSAVPVFVVGPPRSGKMRLERLITTHTSVHGAGELRLLQDTAAEIEAKLTAGAGGGRQLHRGTIDFRARRYLAELRRRAPEAARIVDGNANNLMLLGYAALMFPGALVIHCRRDPMDTGLACYAARFAGTQLYSTDLADTGRFLRLAADLWAHWKAVIPNPVLEVDFDQTDCDPAAVAETVSAFLDLDDAAMQPDLDDGGIRFRAAAYGDHLDPLAAALAAGPA